MGRFDLPQVRFLPAADILGVEAAGMEPAARRRVDGTGHIPLEDDALMTEFGVRHGGCGKQRLGVGMQGPAV